MAATLRAPIVGAVSARLADRFNYCRTPAKLGFPRRLSS
jgi:hypothetical protein